MSFLNVSPHGGNRNIRGRNVKADETVPRNQQKLPLSPHRGKFNANPSPTSSPIAGTKQNFSMHSSKRTSAVSTHYFSSPERLRGDNNDEPPISSTRSRNRNESAESPVLGSRSSGIRSNSPVMRSNSPVMRIRSQDRRSKMPVNMRTKSPVMRSMSPVDRDVECSRSYTRSDVYEKDYTRQHPESPPKKVPIQNTKAHIQKAPLKHAPLKRTPVSKKKSPFALLSDDICRFQQMVRELEGHLESSGMSPAAQWKCRILITSNDDLARKIDGGLSDFQLSIGQMEDRNSTGRAHAAYMKLMRDFRRAYAGHESLSGKYQQRQIQEIRKLETKWRPEEREDNMNQQTSSKDLKVMRAREAELREINKKMHTVMTIYKELGQIVGDQTEDVNKAESKINDSKQKAQEGASIFESANLGLIENWKKYLEFDEEPLTTGVERQPTFHWTMPLETFHDDMKSVQNDIFSLGNDLVGKGIKTATYMFQCKELQCNENGGHIRDMFQCNENGRHIRDILQCNELQCNENGGHVRDLLQCDDNDVHIRSYETTSFDDIRSFDITAAETETFEEEKSDYGFY